MDTSKFDKSAKLYEEACRYIPAGVSSNARAFPIFDLFPIFLERAQGPLVWDANGNEMIDLLGGFGAAILGHNSPKVIQAVRKQLDVATILGSPCELEVKTAKLFCELVKYSEQVRFVQSGTEATLHAIRIARAYTDKSKIIKFEGHYHGTHDYVAVGLYNVGGSEIAPNKIPITPGIPEETLSTVILLPWNDLDVVEKTIKNQRNEIAAIITEPIMGNGGLVLPEKGYLEGLRDLCTENDIVLIFDEVVTGFRTALGGAYESFGVKPDMGTFSKALGGGIPCAAICGKKEIMEIVKPGGVFHAGTYNANLISLAGAYATMTELRSQGTQGYNGLYNNGRRLLDGLKEAAERAHQDIFLPAFVGWFALYFTNKTQFRNHRDVLNGIDPVKFSKFASEMTQHGVYLLPDELERMNLSFAHTQGDIDKIIEVATQAFKTL
jgi:glutamate-1-semialdehyde 2,1-aminomutase